MKFFNVFDIEMACRIVGTGPPVLLVHGFPLDHSMWQHQVDYLAEFFRAECAEALQQIACGEESA